MSYVVAAFWKAKPGEEEAVLGLLHRVAEMATTREPGCLAFRVHRSTEDAGTFLLYEEYTSAEAFGEHTTSEHFRELVLGDALNRLESRRRETYETV